MKTSDNFSRISPPDTRPIPDVKITMEISDNTFYFVSGYINDFLKKVDDFYEQILE
jgi:hypothetical protein